MPFKAVLALSLSACALALSAGWDPIPEEVWAMKEDPAHGIKGAVVLEERLTFHGTGIGHLLRYRILSERGKAVAEMPGFLPEASGIEGRTVQRDGSIVTFDKKKDFSEKTVRLGQTEREVKVVLPPGLTADCVVELRWTDLAQGSRDHQIPDSLGNFAEWRFGGPFPIRKLVVEFTPFFHWSANVSAGSGTFPQVTQNARSSVYTFTDVPAREANPFSLDAVSGKPAVRVFFQPDRLLGYARGKSGDYWKAAAELFIKPNYTSRLKKGEAYKAVSRELLAGLPADPAQAADLLCRRLDRRIINQTWATLEERGSLKKGEKFDNFDLEEACVRGRALARGMAILYFSLATEAGLHPRLGMVRDRHYSLFRYGDPDLWQTNELIVGIPVKDHKTFWVEPSLRFATPGLISPSYQGADALVMDTGQEEWLPQAENIPGQGADFNTSRYQFKLDCADGLEKVSLKTAFTGYREFVERRRFLAQAKPEAERSLKERMEQAIKDASITRASVFEVWNPDQPAHWEVEGSLELASTATLSLDPFPGMPAPLPLPTTWPESRTVPIVMDYLRVQEGECELHLPPGYALQKVAPFRRENRFGSVLFTADPVDAATVKVRFKVELRDLFEPASAEPQLRQFLAWVEDAYHRRLLLEKP